MSKDSKQKINFLFYYQCTLAIGAVLVFFTFLDVYFWETKRILPPVALIGFFGIATFILLFFSRFSSLNYIPFELITWCVGYLGISLFSFLLVSPLSAGVAFQEVKNRILAEFFLLMMSLIFSKYPKIQDYTRIAIFLAVLLAVFNNMIELNDPLVFGGLNPAPERAAGYYINPNRSACALIIGMIFGVTIIPKNIRMFFSIIIFFGTCLTGSRGAMLGWFIVMGIFLRLGLIPRKNFSFWVIVIVTVIFVFGPILSNVLDLNELQRSGFINVDPKSITERLEWFQNPLANKEDSGDARVEVVRIAWDMLSEHPILGAGIAATKNLNNMGISTHNMYLLYMAEHGILGIFILPLLVYAVTWNSRGESKDIAWAFAIFILLWGMFSHNVVEEAYILMSFSLMAAMNVTSRIEQKSKE
jgi:O-antigen ligase